MGELAGTALFGSRFRENAARALLIPRRRPGERTPLWQQRLKAQSLLQVARKFGSFPVMLETFRECLQDVFDLPALKRLLQGLKTRQIDLVDVESASASPYSHLAPLRLHRDVHVRGRHASRRAAGAGAVARSRPPPRAARPGGAPRPARPGSARAGRGLADERARGTRTSSTTCCSVRGDRRVGEFDEAFAAVLETERRAIRIRVGGEERLIAAEDAGRYRDALGAMPPSGLPDAFLTGPTPRRLCTNSSTGGRAAAGRSPPPRRSPTSAATSSRSCSRWNAKSCSCAASSVRAEPSASGATPTSSAGFAAPRSRPFAGRSSRSSRSRSRASSPAGTGSTGGRASARRSSRCRRCRCRSHSGSPRCSRDGFRTTRRHSSTSCARPASSSGSAPASTASPCSSARTLRCWGSRTAADRPEGELHDRIRETLGRSAQFWFDLVRRGRRRSGGAASGALGSRLGR